MNSAKALKVLVIDIGGSKVKFKVYGSPDKRKFPSGKNLTPTVLVNEILALTADWSYDVISIGFPAPIQDGPLVENPTNLGPGWVGFDFKTHLKKPVKLINDAAMQALGSYQGGLMLFIGLGTGLGSALIAENIIIPLELCNLPYLHGKNMEYYLGKQMLKISGKEKWQRDVANVVAILKSAFIPNEIVIGGGNAKHLKIPLVAGTRIGKNEDAFLGGYRLWNPVQNQTE